MSRKTEKEPKLIPAVSFPAYCRLCFSPVRFRWIGAYPEGRSFLITDFQNDREKCIKNILD